MTVTAPPTDRLLEIQGPEFAGAFTRRPMSVRHNLVGHPLLTLDAIAELADRLPLKDVERHRADMPLLMPGGAPEVEGRPSETVRTIQTNGCWMVLWYIEQVPEYRALLDAILADADASIRTHGMASREAAMSPRRREAFLFISAPNALTPVHFDPEQNFLLQISGSKEMNVVSFADGQTANHELERYYDGGHRNLEAMPTGTQATFRMQPGDGVYVPSFDPHWVQNGPEISISLSITFRTRASERFERVHQLNAKLRRRGLHPRPPGVSDRADRAKELVHLAVSESKRTAATARDAVRRRRRARSA
jgi:hypothetical protein